MSQIRCLSAGLLFYALTASIAWSQSTEERVLLPIYTDRRVPGANGWTFATTLQVLAAGARYSLPARDCRVVRCFERDFPFFFPYDVVIPESVNGRFISVEAGKLSRLAPRLVLHYNSRLDSRFRDVRLPVVGEGEFLTGSSDFLKVNGVLANSPTRRYTLYLYLKDAPTANTAFRLTVLAEDPLNTVVLANTSVSQFRRDGNDASYPWYAIFRFPGVLETTCPPGRGLSPCDGDLRLRIDMDDPSAAYWPVLSRIDYITDSIFVDWPT